MAKQRTPSFLSLHICTLLRQFASSQRINYHRFRLHTLRMVLGFTKLFHAALSESMPKTKKYMLKSYVVPKGLDPKPKKPAEVIVIDDEEDHAHTVVADNAEELKSLQVKIDSLFEEINKEYELMVLQQEIDALFADYL